MAVDVDEKMVPGIGVCLGMILLLVHRLGDKVILTEADFAEAKNLMLTSYERPDDQAIILEVVPAPPH